MAMWILPKIERGIELISFSWASVQENVACSTFVVEKTAAQRTCINKVALPARTYRGSRSKNICQC